MFDESSFFSHSSLEPGNLSFESLDLPIAVFFEQAEGKQHYWLGLHTPAP